MRDGSNGTFEVLFEEVFQHHWCKKNGSGFIVVLIA